MKKSTFLIVLSLLSTEAVFAKCKNCNLFQILKDESFTKIAPQNCMKGQKLNESEKICQCNENNLNQWPLNQSDKYRIQRHKIEFNKKVANLAIENFQNNLLALSDDFAKIELSGEKINRSAAQACSLDNIDNVNSCKSKKEFRILEENLKEVGGFNGLREKIQGEFANMLAWETPADRLKSEGFRNRSTDGGQCLSDMEATTIYGLGQERSQYKVLNFIAKNQAKIQSKIEQEGLTPFEAIEQLGRKSKKILKDNIQDSPLLRTLLNNKEAFNELVTKVGDREFGPDDIKEVKKILSLSDHLSKELEIKCHKIYSNFKKIACGEADLSRSKNNEVLVIDKDQEEFTIETNDDVIIFCQNVKNNSTETDIDRSIAELKSTLPKRYQGRTQKISEETYNFVSDNNKKLCPRIANCNKGSCEKKELATILRENSCPPYTPANGRADKFCSDEWFLSYQEMLEIRPIQQSLLASEEQSDKKIRAEFATVFFGKTSNIKIKELANNAGLIEQEIVQENKQTIANKIKSIPNQNMIKENTNNQPNKQITTTVTTANNQTTDNSQATMNEFDRRIQQMIKPKFNSATVANDEKTYKLLDQSIKNNQKLIDLVSNKPNTKQVTTPTKPQTMPEISESKVESINRQPLKDNSNFANLNTTSSVKVNNSSETQYGGPNEVEAINKIGSYKEENQKSQQRTPASNTNTNAIVGASISISTLKNIDPSIIASGEITDITFLKDQIDFEKLSEEERILIRKQLDKKEPFLVTKIVDGKKIKYMIRPAAQDKSKPFSVIPYQIDDEKSLHLAQEIEKTFMRLYPIKALNKLFDLSKR